MHVTETLSDGLRRQFKVILPAATVDGHINAKLLEIGRTVKLPGFRPGKIPMTLLKQRYSGSVMGEVLETAIQESTGQTLTERGLRPAMQPKVEIISFAPGVDLEFTIDFETLPDVPEPDLSGLKLERMTVEVAEEAVEENVNKVLANRKVFVALETPRPAEMGDQVKLNFLGKIEGVPFDGGAADDFPLTLGSGQFIPGFEAQLVGASVGEERVVTVSFPEDYGSTELAGKEATFECKINEILGAQMPELTDEFVKTLGLDDVAAFRQAVRDQITREYQGAARQKLKRSLLDQLSERNDFGVPVGMVDAEFESIWKEVEETRARGVIDPETADKTDEEVKSEFRTIADRRVRLGLLLSDIGRRNNIQVTEDEVRRAVFDQARRYPGKEKDVIDFYRNTQGAIDSLRAPIFEEKVVDFVLEMATVTDKPVTAEELLAEVEA
jgi:trigger factor